MYCPGCGSEENQANQFCRACGYELGRARAVVATADGPGGSASNGRDEIGRAIAMKIRETRTAGELSVMAEEVLPRIEKFLESPAEKRLRRMRTGTLLSSIGLGAAIGISIAMMFMNDHDIVILAGLGVVTFFIGLGFILNGIFLTLPKKEGDGHSTEVEQQQIDAPPANVIDLPSSASFLSEGPAGSVTENTTRHLSRKEE